jgi:hypothetical protein
MDHIVTVNIRKQLSAKADSLRCIEINPSNTRLDQAPGIRIKRVNAKGALPKAMKFWLSRELLSRAIKDHGN